MEVRICRQCQVREAAFQRTVCNTCKSRNWIDKNPIPYAWHMLKKSAKKRNIPFTLTIKYFTKLCLETGYIEKAGRLMNDYTIDRIREWEGYHDDNVQVLQKGANTSKYFDYKRQQNDFS